MGGRSGKPAATRAVGVAEALVDLEASDFGEDGVGRAHDDLLAGVVREFHRALARHRVAPAISPGCGESVPATGEPVRSAQVGG